MLRILILLILPQVLTLDVYGESQSSRKYKRRAVGDLEHEIEDIIHELHEVNELKRQSSSRRGVTWDSDEVIAGDNGGWGNGNVNNGGWANDDLDNVGLGNDDLDNGRWGNGDLDFLDRPDDGTGLDWSHDINFEADQNSWVDSIGDEVDDDRFWGV